MPSPSFLPSSKVSNKKIDDMSSVEVSYPSDSGQLYDSMMRPARTQSARLYRYRGPGAKKITSDGMSYYVKCYKQDEVDVAQNEFNMHRLFFNVVQQDNLLNKLNIVQPLIENSCVQTPEIVGEEIDPSEDFHFNNIVRLVLVLGLKYNLVHGDLSNGNIIFSKGKYTFLDFEFSRRGGPYLDLAHLLIYVQAREERVNNDENDKDFTRINATNMIEEILPPFINEVEQILNEPEFNYISFMFDADAMRLALYYTLNEKYDLDIPKRSLHTQTSNVA
mgnify:FL=1